VVFSTITFITFPFILRKFFSHFLDLIISCHFGDN
jgi:hypothetical protein